MRRAGAATLGARRLAALRPGAGRQVLRRERGRRCRPAPRGTVTLGTVQATPRPGSSLDDNRQLQARLVEAAGPAPARTRLPARERPDRWHRSHQREAASRWRGPPWVCSPGHPEASGVWVVVQFPQREGHRVYNAAALLDRRGRVAGVYHKMHLTTGEWERGIVPGDGALVVDTELGRLGVLICFDLHFPKRRRNSPPWQGPRWSSARRSVTAGRSGGTPEPGRTRWRTGYSSSPPWCAAQ